MPDTWIEWGIAVINLAQSPNSNVIDALFRIITFLGDTEFFLVLLPLVYWTINKQLGMRLAALLLLSGYFNLVLKTAFGWPRPPADRVRQLVAEETFGMPSGHAQNSIVIWGFLSGPYGPAVWLAAALLAIVVGASRVFLGAHYPQDVVGGWLVGMAFLATAWLAFRALEARPISSGPIWAAALVGPALLAALHPTPDAVRAMGALWGLGVGYLLERRYLGFRPRAVWYVQAAKMVVGIAIMFGLRVGLKALFPDAALWHFLRYAIMGLWGIPLAPWLFVKLGWASQSSSG
jgi:membrane-associated phospholipid phosphatase